ncbi:MAG: transglutaminase domain-containing protein [Xanthobacteraceae bacterium]|nr:transglutaminase domain-containing protein [Xanthobacteraceae bacterium]
MKYATEIDVYLSPAEYVDSDHEAIIDFAERTTFGERAAQGKLQAIYNAVRDDILYNPYLDFTSPETFRASSVLKKGVGYCVGKASLFAAACRALDIPARLGFADVRNHLATPRLLETMSTNLFVWHGYVECLVEGKWIKASPTFNATLCRKLGVEPLPFDGTNHALLHEFDGTNARFMEYEVDHGHYFDVPTKFLIGMIGRVYPILGKPGGVSGTTMEEEAARLQQ